MRKVLIPTDFSENSLNALKYAVEVFKYEQCDFFILHAYADEVYDQNAHMARELFNEIKENVYQNSEKELIKIEEILQQISPNPRHSYHTLSKFGHLVDESNEIIEEENVDIVVMGTKGKTDNSKITFGSNTLQVIKYVKSPVLVIPNGCTYTPPKNILFPSDYQLPYKRRELKLLYTMARSFRSKINFLLVSTNDKLSIRQEDNKEFLETSLSGIELESHKVSSDSLTTAINQFIEHKGIDFLVMVNSRHSYMENILYTSTIDTIGLEIKIPFLVMQNVPRI